MKKGIIGFLIFLAISWQMSAYSCFAGTLDKVIVVVNGETITQSELDMAYSGLSDKLEKKFKGEELAGKMEEAKQNILNRMVEEKLILSEAKRLKVEATDAQIDDKLKEVKSTFESDEKFDEALKEEGVSLDELEQRYADQIIVANLADIEVRKKIIISPSEVSGYYDTHKEDFKEPEQVRVKNILIKPDDNLTDAHARELAEKTLGFLKAGEDFGELALKYSKGPNADRGGDLGFVKKGQMLKEIDDAIFNLKAGEFSEAIKTQLGYHIFKVEEKIPEGIQEFSKVKDQIESRLFFEKGKERYAEWIKALKKNAYISFR